MIFRNSFLSFKLTILSFCFTVLQILHGQNGLPLNTPLKNPNMPSWTHLLYNEPLNLLQIDSAYKVYYQSHPFEKNHYTRYYKRLIMNNRMNTNSDGFIIDKDVASAELQFNHSLNSRKAPNIWRPYDMETYFLENNQVACPWQVNVYRIDVCKSNPNFLVASSETGGIFKSADKGKQWQQIGLSYVLGTEAIAVHPRSVDTIYIGTNGAIRRTTDGGTTWNNVYVNAGIEFYEILVLQNNTNIILAASTKGLFRSIDNGLMWTQVFTDVSCDIKVHPSKPNIVYCLKYDPTKKQYQVWKSTNSGQSFTSRLSGWHGLADGGARLAITAADPKRVYAISLTQTQGPYLMRSNDEGESWTIQAKGSYTGFDSPEFPMDNWQGYYDLALMASQTNADQLITGTGSTYKSSDGGKTFKVIGGYGGSFNLHPDLQSCISIGNDAWIATDGGLTYSTDFFTDTKNAVSLNKGLYGSDFWGFDAGWNEKVFVGGRYHNGNTIWHENYQNKFIRMGGAESATGYVNPINSRQVFFSDIGAYQMPEKYSPNWKWSGLPTSVWPNESYYAMEHSQMVWSPICYEIVYIGNGNKLMKSYNNGASYETIYTAPNVNDEVEWIEISRSNPDVIYITTRNNSLGEGLVFKSTNGGKSFTVLTHPNGTTGGQRRVHKIVLSPTDENDLVLGLRTGNTANKVFRSKDGGKTWINWTTSKIMNASINDLCWQYGTDGGIYLAADDGHMYYRNNNMADWEDFNSGLGVNHFTRALKPFYRDGILLNGGNMGVWEVPFFEDSKPLAQPTVDRLTSSCVRDTFYFDDYSVFTKDSVSSWKWNFQNAQYVSDPTIRNPKVVFGKQGTFDVSLTIKNKLGESTKTVSKMIQISANECSIDSFANKSLDLSKTNDYATLKVIPELKNATGFTCMAWIKLNSPQDCFTQILSNWDSNVGFGFGFAFQGYVRTRNLTFFWKDVPYQLTSSFNLDTLKWIHVAMVVYPDSVRLYRDGESWTYKGNFKNFDLSETPWEVGTGVRGQCGNFQGQMDELKIYNRSLSQVEIRDNMHLIHPEGEAGLVGYYQFNESNNNEIYNRVGGYHGSNSGGTKTISTAPIGTGTSSQLILKTGTNVFTLPQLSLEQSTVNKQNSTWHAFQLLNTPDSVLQSTGMWNSKYYIVRSFGNTTKESASNMIFTNTGIPLNDYRFAPQYLKLYQRDLTNEHLNTWKFIANASKVNLLDQSIQFNNIADIKGQYMIEYIANPNVNTTDLYSKPSLIYVYPNPGKNDINIFCLKNGLSGMLQIQDMTGKVILSKPIYNFIHESIDIHDLTSGIYVVSFLGDKVKFVKE
ncbi:MAG: T9SS type A sorting domain-containing protein [Saprospiraceae bacterium]|nr:T9SS type A sorting domain-containing protein [Candidatus Defluviibacterium haderslevense]